jgi:hypothetical protein
MSRTGGQVQFEPEGPPPLFSIGTRDKAHGVAGIGRAGRAGLQVSGSRLFPVSGGRTWWAHFDFTRINIEPIILKNKIEDLREAGAPVLIASGTSRDRTH